MKKLFSLMALGLLTLSLVGCAEKETGPVTTAEELEQYNVPEGVAEEAAAAAAAAAKGGGN